MVNKRNPPRILKHQTQPTSNSCMSTCVAMMLDLPATVVIEKHHENVYELQDKDVSEVLEEEGFVIDKAVAGMHSLYQGNLYFLTVPSLNATGGFHQVIVDFRKEDIKVYDPAKGRIGKRYYSRDQEEIENNRLCELLHSWFIDFRVEDGV